MAKQHPTTSLIFALHARYEIAWVQYRAIEARKIGAKNGLTVRQAEATDTNLDDHALVFRLEEAAKRNSAEEVALNQALLYQVPTTWEEALILAAHLKIAGIDEGEQLSGSAQQAAETGFDTLLDFMFGEIDHDKLDCAGEQLLNIANIVYERRRMRRGEEL